MRWPERNGLSTTVVCDEGTSFAPSPAAPAWAPAAGPPPPAPPPRGGPRGGAPRHDLDGRRRHVHRQFTLYRTGAFDIRGTFSARSALGVLFGRRFGACATPIARFEQR